MVKQNKKGEKKLKKNPSKTQTAKKPNQNSKTQTTKATLFLTLFLIPTLLLSVMLVGNRVNYIRIFSFVVL